MLGAALALDGGVKNRHQQTIQRRQAGRSDAL